TRTTGPGPRIAGACRARVSRGPSSSRRSTIPTPITPSTAKRPTAPWSSPTARATGSPTTRKPRPTPRRAPGPSSRNSCVPEEETMRVGFIGLGLMGSGMTNNLQKAGHQLVLHDLRRETAEKLLAAGAEWADSPRAVAAESEVVFTSLPGPPEFE